MFMLVAPTAADPTRDPAPRDTTPRDGAPGGTAAAGAAAEATPRDQIRDQERAGHLGLVRALIAYGRDMVASRHAANAPTSQAVIALRFGSLSVAPIIARITRGLMLAGALEQRLRRKPPTNPS